MKKQKYILILALLGSVSIKAADLALRDGRVLKDYKILNTSAIDAAVLHEGGLETVHFDLMPEEVQKEYSYNSEKNDEQATQEVPSNAESSGIKKEIAMAAAIENSVRRLAAYDEIAVKHGLAPRSEVLEESEGKWRITTDVSPIDDSKSIFCFLEADSSVQVGYDTIKPTLVIRYKEGELDGYITYDVFLGSDTISATLRFGKEGAEQATWGISTDHKAAFIRGDIGYFINRLERVNSFIVRLTPYGESSVTVSFSPQGIGAVKQAIRSAM